VASIILGRPSATCIDISILATDEVKGYVEFWEAGLAVTSRTPVQVFREGEPTVVHLQDLRADMVYRYRLCYVLDGSDAAREGPEYAFHTQRAPGSRFTFEIQGDSHPERPQQHNPALYAQTLRAAAADRPDFYVTIGDDFSVDTLRTVTAEAVEQIYRGQRRFLSLVGHSAPVFLVNGNHEQAAMCNLDGTPNNVAVWAQNARNRFFPQPAPDGFYTGDTGTVEFIGPLRDYYAWTWGDALFVVIDPYWHSPKPVDKVFGGGVKTRDMWVITLGEPQHQWLKRTLEESQARYKFVFAHHVLGTGRGGIEMTDLYEWGGRNRRGDWEFDQQRLGWELPIHQLMVRSGVTILFQGHDHIFAKQEKDGVIYQTLPEPADPNYALYNRQAYRSGDVLPNSGRVRVTVSAAEVRVEYIRSFLRRDESPAQRDGAVTCSYTITARNG
jgi:hypothetical protein